MALKVVKEYTLIQSMDGVYSANVKLELPAAKVLHVEIIKGSLLLWLLCDKEDKTELREFDIVGTGIEFEKKGRYYIGSVREHVEYTNYMWHVFERDRYDN